MDAKTVARSARETADSAGEALGWVADPRNAGKVSPERAPVELKLRRVAGEGLRLERTAERPTCVGVFGPSQAGKSYLISILARQGHQPLIATFAGDRPEVDFIQDINPPGGDESTGVVTRFTTRAQPAPPNFPVCLRLLTEADIVKILVNSYFQDGNQEYETVPDAASLERKLAAAEAASGAAGDGRLAEAEVWDIQDYVHRNAGGAAGAAALEPFWSRMAAVAPRLRLADRAALFSLLWGGHDTYSAIYTRLVGALARLGFAEEAFCPVSALVPNTASIINVQGLAGLHDEKAATLDVSTAAGTVAQLPRPVVTALIAELRIVCRDKPLAFFDHTDLLDFPGYRTRFKYDLQKYFRDAVETAPKEMFLRGKVDYLFQRYTSDLELTTMILCIPDSVMEVANLPKAVESWVGMTHGAEPAARAGKPALLFFAMTKFDRTLERKAGGQEGNLADKFQIRFNASLSPFAKVEPSWVRQWTPRRPFRNVFLIRNPNVQFMGVVDYDGAREVGLNPLEAPRLAELRQAFVALPAAADHFADPAAAWDALMALNDGGAQHLARGLEAVIRPDLKLEQVVARLATIRAEAVDLLRPFHVSDDLEKRREERLAVVDERIFPDLNRCAERGAFGTALRGLMIDDSDLHATLAEALNRGAAEPSAADGPIVVRPPGPFGGVRKDPPKRPGGELRADRWSRLAEAALGAWAGLLHGRVDDAAFGRRVGIEAATLREIVAEITGAARRLDLAGRIATELRARAAPSEQNEAVARKAALVAERLINRFVAELDFDRVAPATQLARFGEDLDEPVFAARRPAFDTTGIGPERPDFGTRYMEQWGRAFRATVSANAVSQAGSLEDAAQNARLGRILQALAAPC